MATKSFIRKPVYTKISIAIFLAMMITATLKIVPVTASPITVTVSPTSGTVGTTATVSGNNATNDGEVRVYAAVFFFGFFMATTTANSTGGYSVNITVPAMPAGAYPILVADVATGDTNTITFTIQPEIVLTPDEESSGEEVIVKGYGFNNGVPVTITFGGTDVTPMPQPWTEDFGSFEARFRVPSMPNGTYIVTADDGVNKASASFTMIPKITLSPTSGPPATPIFLSGSGFAPGVAVSIELDGINVTMHTAFPTGIDGSFMQLFFVPDVPNGSYTVQATDANETSATAPFTVPSPVMTLTPDETSGPSIVTATGSGFPPNTPILLYLEGIITVNLVDLMTESQTLLADEYGSYEHSFILPVEKPGVYTVIAYSLAEGPELTIREELASATLTIIENTLLTDIKDDLTTVIIPDLGTIKVNLADINAKIIGINGTVVTIETDIGTMQTDLTAINAKLVSIDGTIATIETDMGTMKTDLGTIGGDVSGIQAEVVPTAFELGILATILALVAAIGAWLSTILIRRKPVQLFTTEKRKKSD